MPCVSALDVGCGEGLLVRHLAERCGVVTGLDSDSRTLGFADKKEPRFSNVTFTVGDVMTYAFPKTGFTFLSSVASLHHLPL